MRQRNHDDQEIISESDIEFIDETNPGPGQYYQEGASSLLKHYKS